MVKYELNLGCPADAVEGFKMSACKHDGVAIIKNKTPLEQATLLHTLDGVGQLDVVHIHKLMPCEQTDAVMPSAELDGGPEQSLHTTVVGQLGDEIATILMRTIGAVGILIHFLQSDEIGLVLLDEFTNLLQTGIMAGMKIKGHDPNGVAVTLGKGHTGQ